MTSDELQDLPVQRNKDQLLDRRLTVLETRFDTTMTMLPNKADLSELKAELKTDIHGESARLNPLERLSSKRPGQGASAMTVPLPPWALLDARVASRLR